MHEWERDSIGFSLVQVVIMLLAMIVLAVAFRHEMTDMVNAGFSILESRLIDGEVTSHAFKRIADIGNVCALRA